MVWMTVGSTMALPTYSKSRINKAGEQILLGGIDEDANLVIDSWRNGHNLPLFICYENLKRIYGDNEDVIVVQRSKRLDSITKKIDRQRNMKLCRMQDIAGCRIILKDMVHLAEVVKDIKSNQIISDYVSEHPKLVKIDDYILEPKLSGYRSVHMIMNFSREIYTMTNSRWPIYDDVKVEIQIRTYLQHLWSTALETTGLFFNQNLKAGDGDKSILNYFAIVSDLFSFEECTPRVTTKNKEQLVEELRSAESKLLLLDRLSAIRVAVERYESFNFMDGDGYSLLKLNYYTHRLKLQHFKVEEENLAVHLYHIYELEKTDYTDVVLVRSANMKELKEAYPNYFSDVEDFIIRVGTYLDSKYRENYSKRVARG